MNPILRSSVDCQRASSRAGLRTPVTFARLWTGRARVSAATNTLIPRCVTTTTHRTRVSEMRSFASRVDSGLIAPLSTGTFSHQRRDPGHRVN